MNDSPCRKIDDHGLVVAVAVGTQEVCEFFGRDAADGAMALLTAAVYVLMRHSGKSATALRDALADSLGDAIIAADDWFKPEARH